MFLDPIIALLAFRLICSDGTPLSIQPLTISTSLASLDETLENGQNSVSKSEH
jgi:hypothetical protein